MVFKCILFHSTDPSGSGVPHSPITLKAANIQLGRYIYREDLLRLCSCEYSPSTPQWLVRPSQFCIQNWAPVCESHPDQQYAKYIHTGLSQGFRIGFDMDRTSLKSSTHSHPSATDNQVLVSEYIRSEVECGRLVGPVPEELVPRIKISPIGLIPKPHQVGKWRLIVDLSYPRDHSVNAGISEELASITYAHVDDAVECIKTLGVGTMLIKMDLESAYRQIPVHPGDHHLLGVSWEGRTYVDRALPFGLRSAPKIFSAVADMMVWVLYNAGIEHLIRYLDDFLFLVAPHSDDGAKVCSLAMSVFSKLGVPVALHKTEGPACIITFLGICIDTIAGELRLPQDKLHRLKKLIKVWSTKRASTKKELESFLGHLSHAATVVRPGRTFLRELFALLHRVKQPHHYTRLSAGARADIMWWKCLLQHWSGHSFFSPSPIAHHIYSDASGSWGCGAIAETIGWFQVPWTQQWLEVDISISQ